MRTFFVLIIFTSIFFACKNDQTSGNEPQNAPATGNQAAQPVQDTSGGSTVTHFNGDSVLQNLPAVAFEKVIFGRNNIPTFDLRHEALYQKGHIYKSINTPFDTTSKFEARFETLGRTSPVALYDDNGYFTRQAAIVLRRMGFRRIYTLEGGLQSWFAAGRAVVTDAVDKKK